MSHLTAPGSAKSDEVTVEEFIQTCKALQPEERWQYQQHMIHVLEEGLDMMGDRIMQFWDYIRRAEGAGIGSPADVRRFKASNLLDSSRRLGEKVRAVAGGGRGGELVVATRDMGPSGESFCAAVGSSRAVRGC